MKKIKNSRGELTTQQIVLLIILVTSFSIILFFFFKLNLGEETQKTICRNSVILKGNSVIKSGNLDCRINYLCISGGEDCEGINPTETVEVDISNKEEIMESIANEMADCWWQFGEGKVDYVGSYIGTHCAVCSTIAFDESLKEITITYKELFEFLEKNKKDGSQTYLEYLFGVSKADSFVSDNDYITKNYDVPFSFDERYSIITGRNKELISSDSIIPVYFMKTRELDESTCTKYDVTKA